MGSAHLVGVKKGEIVPGHNSTRMSPQNFSTTAPGRKFRDLQVQKIHLGPWDPFWGNFAAWGPFEPHGGLAAWAKPLNYP